MNTSAFRSKVNYVTFILTENKILKNNLDETSKYLFQCTEPVVNGLLRFTKKRIFCNEKFYYYIAIQIALNVHI